MTTHIYGGQSLAFQFLERLHLRGLETLSRDGTQLWRLMRDDANDSPTLPKPELLADAFWAADEIAFGTAGSIVSAEYTYLFGATPENKLALARCTKEGFLGDLSDRSRYSFFVGGGASMGRAAES